MHSKESMDRDGTPPAANKDEPPNEAPSGGGKGKQKAEPSMAGRLKGSANMAMNALSGPAEQPLGPPASKSAQPGPSNAARPQVALSETTTQAALPKTQGESIRNVSAGNASEPDFKAFQQDASLPIHQSLSLDQSLRGACDERKPMQGAIAQQEATDGADVLQLLDQHTPESVVL